ncbi:MAG: cell division ATP-binding protein FtsE [Oscillospiraceae bacterium]|nr:cell division ATP-binding protein FtsE [Oscillospiraceae bacterium]
MIEFNNVSKTYDNGTAALKNVSLKINDGEFVFVVGSSGAGKSTFLKIIMREQVPNSGTVVINDYNLNRIKKRDIPKFRRTMGIVFQDFRLIPTMTVYDNVAFAMRVIGAKEREISKRVPYVLSLVGLTSKARQFPNQLSGGEQQRVALSRALVNNAGILIADEPTGNIDPEMSYEIVDLLNHINANGTTIVMVTHEHELVRQFNHRVITIDNGEIVSDTLETEINEAPESIFEAVVADDDKTATKQELIEAAQQDIQASVDKIREEQQAAASEISDEVDTAYYIQPNSDKDLEDFMKNYGIDSNDISDDVSDVDYSAYLTDSKDGGDAE